MRVAALVVLLLAGGAPAWAESPSGEALYARHCARCHGLGGRGDGPDGASLEVPPGDLTRAELHAGNDPERLVDAVLEGASGRLTLRFLRVPPSTPETDALVEYLRRLPSVSWSEAERGRSIYLVRCASCHGIYGEAGAPLVGRGVLSGPGKALRAAVAHDRPGLPALADGPDPDEAEALARFVSLLSPGYESYQRYCESCHGPRGRGWESPGAEPWIAFDESYLHSRLPDDLRARVWHMLRGAKPFMPHFADALSRDDVRAILEWLRSRVP